MTPREWLKINTTVTHHKDGSTSKSIDASAKKDLINWETAIGNKLAKVRQYLATNPPSPTKNQYSGAEYIDYYHMNTSLTKAEKTTQDKNGENGLTHLQTSQRMAIPIPSNNPNAPTQYEHKFCAVTILHYHALDLPVGIIPVHMGGYNKGAKMNNNSQNFGGSLTTAKRQSLSLVFGIAPQSGDEPSGSFGGNSGGWNNSPRRSNSGWGRNNSRNRTSNNGGWNNTPTQSNNNWGGSQSRNQQTNRPTNGGSRKNFSRAGANSKKVNSKLTVSRPQSTITNTQYRTLDSLVKKAHAKTNQPTSIYISYIRSAGELANNASISNLPQSKYNHVLNGLKTMVSN